MKNKNLKIAFFGSYMEKLPAVTLLVNGLLQHRQGHSVRIIHEPVPLTFIRSAENLALRIILIRIWYRVRALAKLILRSYEILQMDVLIVLTPGHSEMLLAAVFRRFFAKKVVYIPQVSFYDLLRFIFATTPAMQPIVKLAFYIERGLFRQADVVIFNTPFEVTYHKELLKLPFLKTAIIPLGADDGLFYPSSKKNTSGILEVLYYGEYIPTHGAITIVMAAKALKNRKDIHFTMIGEGITKPQVLEIITREQMENVTIKGWVSPEELADSIRQADIVLGFLGGGPLSDRVVPNKVYQGIACGKCVITGTSPAILNQFRQRSDIYRVPPQNAKALSRAIVTLKTNPALRERIAKNGYKKFVRNYNQQALARDLIGIIESLDN